MHQFINWLTRHSESFHSWAFKIAIALIPLTFATNLYLHKSVPEPSIQRFHTMAQTSHTYPVLHEATLSAGAPVKAKVNWLIGWILVTGFLSFFQLTIDSRHVAAGTWPLSAFAVGCVVVIISIFVGDFSGPIHPYSKLENGPALFVSHEASSRSDDPLSGYFYARSQQVVFDAQKQQRSLDPAETATVRYFVGLVAKDTTLHVNVQTMYALELAAGLTQATHASKLYVAQTTAAAKHWTDISRIFNVVMLLAVLLTTIFRWLNFRRQRNFVGPNTPQLQDIQITTAPREIV
jgi:hypothetical protein